ncbi:hypothetical protein HPB47_018023 [Ixodes persulcatus]|uniref:Uncharacterized protein n=1 Tax=Ixodes persulcatus TaxID=34615 RepID=A0AC60QLU8_IXOPE|nr:hypothetical protein HPB47_018023 [Ixodes persulcatus]
MMNTLATACGLKEQEGEDSRIWIRKDQNLMIFSTHDVGTAKRMARVKHLTLNGQGYDIGANIAAPDDSCRGVITKIGFGRDVCPYPEQYKCSTCGLLNGDMEEHECSPYCIHCKEQHPSNDLKCPARKHEPRGRNSNGDRESAREPRNSRAKTIPTQDSRYSNAAAAMAAATFTVNEDLAIPLAGAGNVPHTSTAMEPGEPAFLPRTNDGNAPTERVPNGTGVIGKKKSKKKTKRTAQDLQNREEVEGPTATRRPIRGEQVSRTGQSATTKESSPRPPPAKRTLIEQQSNKIQNEPDFVTREEFYQEPNREPDNLASFRGPNTQPERDRGHTTKPERSLLLPRWKRGEAAQEIGQKTRLGRTRTGRALLRRLGYDGHSTRKEEESELKPAHPTIAAKMRTMLIPRNMHPIVQAGRRLARENPDVLYADAASYSSPISGSCIAVCCPNGQRRAAASLLRSPSVAEAEEVAIALAISSTQHTRRYDPNRTTFPNLHHLHLFFPGSYRGTCPGCNSPAPTLYRCTWACPTPLGGGIGSITNPSTSSWETALLGTSPEQQRELIGRARKIAVACGALDVGT